MLYIKILKLILANYIPKMIYNRNYERLKCICLIKRIRTLNFSSKKIIAFNRR